MSHPVDQLIAQAEQAILEMQRAGVNGWPNVMRDLADALAQGRPLLAIEAFVTRVNARAEADMLSGRPVTGAHHRAIEAELVFARQLAQGRLLDEQQQKAVRTP